MVPLFVPKMNLITRTLLTRFFHSFTSGSAVNIVVVIPPFVRSCEVIKKIVKRDKLNIIDIDPINPCTLKKKIKKYQTEHVHSMSRKCFNCEEFLDKDCYSSNQWRKKSLARCRACVNGGSSGSSQSQKRRRLDTARCNNSSSASFTNYALSHPFASGTFRWVAKGSYTTGARSGEACVTKWFKSGHHFEKTFFNEDIKAVEKAIDIVSQFNQSNIIDKTIKVNRAEVWTFTDSSGSWSGRKSLTEPYIADWVKFNSNSGWADDSTIWGEVMQALSHFSYHVSSGKFVLCDLQGGLYSNGAILTDPVILSRTKSYGITDLGELGISNFFARHECNRYCKARWQQPRKQSKSITAYKGTTMVGAGHAPTHSSKPAMTAAYWDDTTSSDDY